MICDRQIHKYPLVINLTYAWKITISNGQFHYKLPFSLAMLNYQGLRQVFLPSLPILLPLNPLTSTNSCNEQRRCLQGPGMSLRSRPPRPMSGWDLAMSNFKAEWRSRGKHQIPSGTTNTDIYIYIYIYTHYIYIHVYIYIYILIMGLNWV